MKKYLITYRKNGIYTNMCTAYGGDICDAADRYESRFKNRKVLDIKSHPVKNGFLSDFFIWIFF